MFSRPFHPEQFLRSVIHTEPFLDYCRDRGIPFQHAMGAAVTAADLRRWTVALSELPHDQHAQVELELATVNELAGADGVAHLLDAAGEVFPPTSVPRGAPVSLWYFLHRPACFHDVFFHHEIRDVESWRTAETLPGVAVTDPSAKSAALAEALRSFFQLREGRGHFCTVEATRFPTAPASSARSPTGYSMSMRSPTVDSGCAGAPPRAPGPLRLLSGKRHGPPQVSSPRPRPSHRTLRMLRSGGAGFACRLMRRCVCLGDSQAAVPPAARWARHGTSAREDAPPALP